MDPLSDVQLRILREAATPEGCRKYRQESAYRLLRLLLVERFAAQVPGAVLLEPATETRLRATAAGREWLRKVDAGA